MSNEITVTGFVAYIGGKSGTNGGRAYTSYSMKIQDAETGEELPLWYQLGFDDPKLVEGDYIRFIAVPHDNKAARVDIATIKKGKNPPARPAKSGDDKPASSKGNGKGGGYSNKKDPKTQAQITMQHSQEMAIRAVTMLLLNDGLPVSGAKTKAGQTKRFNEITNQIDKFTIKYHNDVISLRLLDTVEDFGLIDVKAMGELPDDVKETAAPAPSEDDGFEDATPAQTPEADDDADFE